MNSIKKEIEKEIKEIWEKEIEESSSPIDFLRCCKNILIYSDLNLIFDSSQQIEMENIKLCIKILKEITDQETQSKKKKKIFKKKKL